MFAQYRASCLIGAVGLLLLVTPACSKKSIEAGSEAQSLARAGSQPPGLPDGAPLQEREEDRLTGFQAARPGQTLPEERIPGESVIAQTDSPNAARGPMDEMQQERLVAAAGLKDVYFDFDSWKLSEESVQTLLVGAEWLKTNPTMKVTIEGHCDERGTQAYNLVLGEKRAKAVRNYLTNLNVDPSRFTIVSYGKGRPFCEERNEGCYQQNRRGHFALRTQ